MQRKSSTIMSEQQQVLQNENPKEKFSIMVDL